MGIPSPGSREWVPGDGTTEIKYDAECVVDLGQPGCGWKGTVTADRTGDLVEWTCPKCDREYEEDI